MAQQDNPMYQQMNLDPPSYPDVVGSNPAQAQMQANNNSPQTRPPPYSEVADSSVLHYMESIVRGYVPLDEGTLERKEAQLKTALRRQRQRTTRAKEVLAKAVRALESEKRKEDEIKNELLNVQRQLAFNQTPVLPPSHN